MYDRGGLKFRQETLLMRFPIFLQSGSVFCRGLALPRSLLRLIRHVGIQLFGINLHQCQLFTRRGKIRVSGARPTTATKATWQNRKVASADNLPAPALGTMRAQRSFQLSAWMMLPSLYAQVIFS